MPYFSHTVMGRISLTLTTYLLDMRHIGNRILPDLQMIVVVKIFQGVYELPFGHEKVIF